jgi:hypothetical protein
MTQNEKKLVEIIEDVVVALINVHLSDRNIHLEKHEHSLRGYDFVNINNEIIKISDDAKMDIKALVEGEIYKSKIGLGFHLDGYLLLGFSKLKESLKEKG